MKTKKLLAAGLTLSMLAASAMGLAGCKEHEHSTVAVEGKDATCTEAGYEAYYKCSDCDKIFSDKEGTIEIGAPVEISAGHHVSAVAQKNATCAETGYQAHYKCSDCGTLFSDAAGERVIEKAVEIPKSTKHTITAVSEKRETCTEDGYEEHFKCTVCGTLFEDEEGTTVIEAPVAIPAAHRIAPVEKKDATCVDAGYEAHYKCSICGILYADEEGENEIEEPAAIEPTGVHTYEFDFTSETLPTPAAEGGTIETTCIHCGVHGETAYDKGFEKFTSNQTVPDKIEEAGTYYGLYSTSGVPVSVRVAKAGTYTISVQHVFEVSEEKFLHIEGLSIGAYGDPVDIFSAIIMGGAWTTDYGFADEEIAKWQPKVEIHELGGSTTKFTSITVTVEEGDVDFSSAYINLCLVAGLKTSETNGVLVTVVAPE